MTILLGQKPPQIISRVQDAPSVLNLHKHRGTNRWYPHLGEVRAIWPGGLFAVLSGDDAIRVANSYRWDEWYRETRERELAEDLNKSFNKDLKKSIEKEGVTAYAELWEEQFIPELRQTIPSARAEIRVPLDDNGCPPSRVEYEGEVWLLDRRLSEGFKYTRTVNQIRSKVEQCQSY